MRFRIGGGLKNHIQKLAQDLGRKTEEIGVPMQFGGEEMCFMCKSTKLL